MAKPVAIVYAYTISTKVVNYRCIYSLTMVGMLIKT